MPAKSYAFAGNTVSILVGGEETDGKFAVLHVTKPTGTSTPPHSHERETELVYPLSGTVGVETEGQITRVGVGQLAVLPPGRPHRLFNESGTTSHEFVLCAPPIFDRFVAAVGTAVDADAAPVAMTDQDRRRLSEAAPRFGVQLLPSAGPNGPARAAPGQLAERLDVLGARVEVIARLGSGDDDLVLLRGALLPGRLVPLHSHPDPECFFVTGGTLELFREGTGWLLLHAGQAGYIAPNTPHAIRNTGESASDALMVSTVRMARFFAAVGVPATASVSPAATPAELAALPQHVSEYGYWLASPPENAAIGL